MSDEQLLLAATNADPFLGLPANFTPQWSADPKAITSWGWRFIYAKDATKQRQAAWIGGSILGSLSVFESVAATRENYAEGGSGFWAKLGL